MADNGLDAFWQQFLKETGRPADTKYVDAFHFERTEKVANALLALVLEGTKQATSSALPAYAAEGDPVPEIGALSIVTDFAGNPRCVIETTAQTIVPFSQMTYDICKREGEDDTLESWKRNHAPNFQAEADMLGYVFDDDMPVLFEDFKVVYAP